jgi:hypothetical protein
MGTRLLCLCTIALILAASGEARADGKAFTRSADGSAFEPANQRDQRAVISFRNGTERLLITINYYAEPDDQGLWIFPVPGTPDTVHIDLWDVLPVFDGTDDRERAGEIVDMIMFLMRTTHVWPLVLDLPFTAARHAKSKSDEAVDVHAAVERWGLHAEAVTAPSVEALGQHLFEAEQALSAYELQAFEPYLTSDYVLVIVRVTSRAELDRQFGLETDDVYATWRAKERRPCLLVEFPTERAFYPMRPTASYGDEYIPVTIYVLGYVQPKADTTLLDHTSTYHYRDEHSHDALETFSGIEPGSTVEYTVVQTFGDASTYTSDFTFEPVVVRGLGVARAITGLGDMLYVVAVALFLLLSLVSGVLAGAISGIGARRGALLGLLNVASVFGVIIGAARMIKERRMARFVIACSLIFVALTIVVQTALLLSIAP